MGFALIADRPDLGFNDQFLYHHMAEGLADGRGYQIFGEPTLRWPPAYPFLLSLVYRVTGADITAALLLNAVVSTLAVVATHWALRPVLTARAALTAAVIVAALPGQWLFTGTVLTEPLSTLQILVVLGLAVRLPPRWPAALALGVAIGAAALTRGEGALLGLVVVAAWLPGRRARDVLAPVALTGLVAVGVLVPWIARNSSVAGERTGLSLNFAETVYSGHNPTADGGATYATTEVLAPAEAAPFGPQRELANAELLQDLALTWAREHPREELALIPKRIVHLMEGDANAVSIWIEGGEEEALGGLRGPLEVAADVTWYGGFAAFVITVVMRRGQLRRRWVPAVVVLPLVSLVLYGVLLYGNFRYRIPYQPLLALLGCAAWWPLSEDR